MCGFFEKFFENRKTGKYREDKKEWAVCCPFPHRLPNGVEYLEEEPSAHINLEKRVFHCKVCGEGLSEAAFLQKLNPGMTYGEAEQALGLLQSQTKEEDYTLYIQALKQNTEAKNIIRQLGLEAVKDELQLGLDNNGRITFPVYIYGDLIDIRAYHPYKKPKVLGTKGSTVAIFPFDKWINDKRPTLLCAGEKDCAIARVYGFNAITFTGGEGSFPDLFRYSFKDRKVYIVYDNDYAGKQGAERTALLLKEAGAEPYIITGHYEICKEEGEDLHDFFMKYGRTADDLQRIIENTPLFDGKQLEKVRNQEYPLIPIQEALEGRFSNRFVSSRVATVATFESAFRVPEVVEISLMEKETNKVIDTYTWVLSKRNIKDVLRLIEVKEDEQKRQLINLARNHLPPFEKKLHYYSTKIKSTRTVYKAIVTDDIESQDLEKEEYNPFELTVYSLDNQLVDGIKYRIFYLPATHPLQGQRVVGIVDKVEDSDNSVNRFRMTPDVLETLECFQGNPQEKMEELYQRAKAFIGAELDRAIFFATELFYHTPLEFEFAGRTERAYLEVMLVGESRTGKSQTVKKMMEMYELGTIVSLKTATIAGLIGGSQKDGQNGFKTRLGVIPRNHKGAIFFEEFSGGGREIISKLTEIRSSNKVRIQRVSGSKTAAAQVRMMAISNQMTKDGITVPLRRYANGIEVLLELVGAAEDIARYDFCLLVDKPEKYTRPNTKLQYKAYPKESYMNRIRWIWSRSKDQIAIEPEVEDYIVAAAEELNELYDTHINLLGSECWKKLARIAIAVAGITCSMDQSGQKIIVTKDHVDWAYQFLVNCYDNKLFRLSQYVEEERKYRQCDSSVVALVEDLYRKHTVLMKALDGGTGFSSKQLEALSGLSKEDYNKIINRLAESYLIEWKNHQICPSERFRIAMSQANLEDTKLRRLGESV